MVLIARSKAIFVMAGALVSLGLEPSSGKNVHIIDGHKADTLVVRACTLAPLLERTTFHLHYIDVFVFESCLSIIFPSISLRTLFAYYLSY